MTSKELLDLHQKAMFFAQDDLVAAHKGDKKNAVMLYKNAFDIERNAAMYLVDSNMYPLSITDTSATC